MGGQGCQGCHLAGWQYWQPRVEPAARVLSMLCESREMSHMTKRPPEIFDEVPTVPFILKLPNWARVAFAARCGRRVQPLIYAIASLSDIVHKPVVERALAQAEGAARSAGADFTAAVDAANGAFSLASAAGRSDSASAIASGLVAAANAAHAAALAADASRAAGSEFVADADHRGSVDANSAAYALAISADTAAASAYKAATYAALVGVSRAEEAVASASWRDYIILLALTKEHAWTNHSPVDPDLLGALWPAGQPEGWPDDRYVREDAVGGLSITFTVPDDVSDDEAFRMMEDYVQRMNELHRAMGGKGLRISPPAEVKQAIGVKQGVGV